MLREALEEVVGRESVREPRGEHLDGVPLVLEIRPSTAEEVAACLRTAGEHSCPLVAYGGGSKLAWGNRPDAKELIGLSLARLTEPFDLQPDEGVGTAAAGVSLAGLRERAAGLGRRTLLDTAHPGATVGGTVATDAFAGGVSADRRLRNDLLGIQVALSNGTLARAGGRVVKNVTGFDLVRLHCGAFGTLGLITEVTFRLRPVPLLRRILLRDLPSLEEALHQAGELTEAHVETAGVAALERGGGAVLVWALEGSRRDVHARAERFSGEDADEDQWGEVERLLVTHPPDGSSRLRLLGRPSDTAAMCAELDRQGGAQVVALPGVGIVCGNLEESRAISGLEALRRSGITALVECASPELKGGLDVFGEQPDSLPLMRALKSRFDPDRLLAPGRFVGRI